MSFGDKDDEASLEATVVTRLDAPKEELPVLVTGICGRLGKTVARRLHRTRGVVGVAPPPSPDKPKDIVHHQLDLRRKKIRDVLKSTQFGAVIHLGVLHD